MGGKAKKNLISSENKPFTALPNPQFASTDPNPPQAVIYNAEFNAQHHQGPLPSPEVLAQYEKTMPGLADRIVKMAERAKPCIDAQSKRRFLKPKSSK
jgi:uncharacterized membrane protein